MTRRKLLAQIPATTGKADDDPKMRRDVLFVNSIVLLKKRAGREPRVAEPRQRRRFFSMRACSPPRTVTSRHDSPPRTVLGHDGPGSGTLALPASRSILLIIGGGIAAYKCLELIRRLKDRGIATRCILTKAGEQFVTPLAVSSLAGERCFTDLFSLTDEADIGHIALSRSTDLLVVAPATADLIAKMANGLANDLASTALLATDKRVLIAPAMNPRMWQHPATRRNMAQLEKDGVLVVGPNSGAMAERGESGVGRMAEPAEIITAIELALAGDAAKPQRAIGFLGRLPGAADGPGAAGRAACAGDIGPDA
ncbi:3-polyprenyl-4-hydroxybenzoate decarboxylase [Bosea sp. OAE506]